jgi:hypothetical protein
MPYMVQIFWMELFILRIVKKVQDLVYIDETSTIFWSIHLATQSNGKFFARNELIELKYQLGRHAYDNAGTHFLIYFLVLFVHL